MMKSHKNMARVVAQMLAQDMDAEEMGYKAEHAKLDAFVDDIIVESEVDMRDTAGQGDGASVDGQRVQVAGAEPASVEGEGRLKSDVVRDCHLLPQDAAVEKERELQRIATHAVVQLFNAVSKHQKDIQSEIKETGDSERKKTRVLSSIDKRKFIDHLKGQQGTKKSSTVSAVAEPSWSVLRDSFMKSSTLKDWGEGDDGEQPMDSDQESCSSDDT